METFRKYFVIILLAIIIAIVWGGVLLYSRQNYSTINANAELYTKPLSPKFDETILKEVSDRIKSGYAIQPESFFEMTNKGE